MPARQTIFFDDGYYHIYNRGSEKRIIFTSPRTYENFLKRVADNAAKYNVDILIYCLMPNHFHLLVRQNPNGSIVKMISAVQLGFAKYFNVRYQRVGPLFQGRFKAKTIETDNYLLQLSAYIHRNPVPYQPAIKITPEIAAQNQKQLLQYPYSSYSSYLYGNKNKTLKVNTEIILSYFSQTKPKFSYQEFVEKFVPDIEALTPWIHDAE